MSDYEPGDFALVTVHDADWPPEPTGLGAVVEDAEGQRFVLVGPTALDTDGEPTWVGEGTGGFYSWLALDAVRILSEGVQP